MLVPTSKSVYHMEKYFMCTDHQPKMTNIKKVVKLANIVAKILVNNHCQKNIFLHYIKNIYTIFYSISPTIYPIDN